MRRAQELISRQPYKVVLLTTTVVIVSITLVSIPGLVLVLVLVLLLQVVVVVVGATDKTVIRSKMGNVTGAC